MGCDRAMGDAEGDAVDAGPNEYAALALKNLGNEKFNKNDYKGAVLTYKKGLCLDAGNCDLHANLSAAYIHLEKYVEAEEHAIYAMYLRPTFYKGYMRAAKAAHGKGMTWLSKKHLEEGLEKVTDPDGIKELTRLKNQYTSYLSLPANAEKEMTFDDDYDSDQEHDELFGDCDDSDCDDDDDDDDDDDLPPRSQCLAVAAITPPEKETPKKSDVQPLDKTIRFAEKLGDKHELNDWSAIKPPATKASAAKNDKESSQSVGTTNPKVDKQPPVPQTNKTLEEKNEKTQKDTEKKSEKDEEPSSEQTKEATKTQKLHQDRLEFKELLKCGTEAYHNNNFRKAADCYKAARERVGIKLIVSVLHEALSSSFAY